MGRRDPCLCVHTHALAHPRRVTRGWWAREQGEPAGGSSEDQRDGLKWAPEDVGCKLWPGDSLVVLSKKKEETCWFSAQQRRPGVPCSCPSLSCRPRLRGPRLRGPRLRVGSRCGLRLPTQALCWQGRGSAARGPAPHVVPRSCGSAWLLPLHWHPHQLRGLRLHGEFSLASPNPCEGRKPLNSQARGGSGGPQRSLELGFSVRLIKSRGRWPHRDVSLCRNAAKPVSDWWGCAVLALVLGKAAAD